MSNPNPTWKSALQEFPMLSGIEESGYELLASGLRQSALPAGHVIIQEGDAGRQLFLLRQGRVRVYREGAQSEVELMTLSAPSFFGEMSILDEQPRSACVQSLTSVELLILPRIHFELLSEKYPDQFALVAANVARHLSIRMRILGDELTRRG